MRPPAGHHVGVSATYEPVGLEPTRYISRPPSGEEGSWVPRGTREEQEDSWSVERRASRME